MRFAFLVASLLTLLPAVSCGPEPPTPAPTPEQVATIPDPTPIPTPDPGLGDGTWLVGSDIAPGIYAAPGSDLCYWARLGGFSGNLDDIITNSVASWRLIVEIYPQDKGFESIGCGRWRPITEVMLSTPLHNIPDGTWVVGEEVSAGTYSATAGDLCYWERLSGFGNDIDDIIANDLGSGRQIIEIAPTDVGFHTSDCGEWTKINSSPTPAPTLVSTATRPPPPRALPTPLPAPTPTPESKLSLDRGMYQVGTDIQPGIYAGLAGTDVLDSCYWARLSGASGDFSDLISNENASGQFYVEVQPTDKYFKVDCEVTPLNDWPVPGEPLSEIGPGMYLVGRDIAPGTYRGKAGTDVLSSCYWERLSGLSGDLNDLVANDNATGSYYVSVEASDYALKTDCDLALPSEAQ